MAVAALIASLLVIVTLVAGSNPTAAVVAEVVEADIRVTGAVEEAPPGEGVTTNDEMRYRITIENRGPDDLPARSFALTASVEKAGGGLATIEVSRFNGPLIPAPNGDCGVGRRQIIVCTNRQEIQSGRDITLVFGHRHPTAEAGQLAFALSVAPLNEAYTDGQGGNNSYQGPGYSFANQPTTTTTMATTTTIEPTTTMVDSSTTVDPNGSTSSTDASSTTVEETTTTLETTTTMETTTTLATTTTTVATTTTLAPTTTIETTTTTIDAMADDEATLPSQASVLGASDQNEDPTSDEELVLAPTVADPDDGPPYLLLVGLFAVLLLIGGVGLALYAHYNRPPPLVDIRQYQ